MQSMCALERRTSKTCAGLGEVLLRSEARAIKTHWWWTTPLRKYMSTVFTFRSPVFLLLVIRRPLHLKGLCLRFGSSAVVSNFIIPANGDVHNVGPRPIHFAENTPPRGHLWQFALQLDERKQTVSGEHGTGTALAPFVAKSCPERKQTSRGNRRRCRKATMRRSTSSETYLHHDQCISYHVPRNLTIGGLFQLLDFT